MVVQEILQVFYAPHKAFKKIIQEPKYLGPVVVLVIFLIAQIGAAYVVNSRLYFEQTLPTGQDGDTWANNAGLWQASQGVAVINNTLDYINSTNSYYGSAAPYFGTSSVEFDGTNISSLQMFLNDFGQTVDCSAAGSRNFSLRVKIVSPTTSPQNVTIYLFSMSPANYFAYDLTSEFANSTILEQQLWNNITVPVDTAAWKSSNQAATWGNITGLRMDFTWPAKSTVTLRVAGIFFRGVFETQLTLFGTSAVLTNAALSSATSFLFEWLLFTALIWLLIKGLRGNAVWKPIMVGVGFALITLAVQWIILLVAFSSLPPEVNYSLEYLASVPGEAALASASVESAIGSVLLAETVVQIAVYVWTIALGTFIVRYMTAVAPAQSPLVPTTTETENVPAIAPQQFGWLKALLVSAVSFVVTITVMGFLGF